jgi:DNA polymerase-3 subunit beta
MKIIILKENLKNAFLNVERAIGVSNVLPILKNILIKTEKGRIKISATDLEIGITSWINGKIVEEGGITIPANIFGAIINNISDSKLELEVVDSKLKIITEKSQNIIQGIKESDFPIIPTIKSNEYIEIKTSDLKKSLNQVICASSSGDRRPEISGVLLWLKDKKIKLVATDTFRLAEKTIKTEDFKTELDDIKIIIPFKTIQETIKICEDEKKVKVYIDNHQILFNFEDVELISRLIEGSFPDYEAIIPQDIQTSVYIDKNELFNAVKLASVFVGKVSDIKVKTEENKMEISGRETSIGENKTNLEAEIKGEKQELVVNWHYLLDGLKGMESNEIYMGLNGEIKPIMIKSTKDDNYFYILMPIKSNY